MREHWFSDHRDLIKWSVLLHLSRQHSLKAIVWVPYLRTEVSRPSFFYTQDHTNQLIRVQDNVWRFFRDMSRVRHLVEQENIKLRFVKEDFKSRNRRGYSSIIQGCLQDCDHPLLLFLDPDTGLAVNRVNAEHVSGEDVRAAWSFLKRNNWLVLYQHSWRNAEWLDIARSRFAELCDGTPIDIARSQEVANDVAFLCARKP